MRLRILGPMRVWDGTEWQNIGAPKWRALLAALLVRRGAGVSVQQLIEDLWGDDPPRGAVNQVHGYVARARRALGDADGQILASRAPGYTLRLTDDDVDSRRFEALTAQGLTAQRRGDAETAAKLLTEALDLWQGPALADVPLTPLIQTEADRLEERSLVAFEARIDADLELGRNAELVPEIQAAAAENPLREHLWAHLMLALYRSGRQADALDAYQRLYRLLDSEIGVEPDRRVRELHQRILHGDPALDLVAARGSDPAQASAMPRQLPAAVRHFAGREPQLAALDELARQSWQSATTSIAVVTGTAGVGKTSTVVHWAHRVAEQFADGQLYVSLRGFEPSGRPVTPAEAVRGMLDAVGVPTARIPPTLDAQAALYRSVLAGRRMLIVLDNAHDVDQVRPLLPGSSGCVVVVTSRDQLSGLIASEGAVPINLDLLTDHEAYGLLESHLGPERPALEPEAVAGLIERCARLPLALSVAAARALVDPGLSLAKLASQLADARGRLDQLDAGEQATNLRVVLSWSYRGLSPDAARLFRLLGLHPGPDVTAAAAASLAGVDVATVRRLLRDLTRAHLVDEHEPARFTFHDLLRVYAAETATTVDSDAERREATYRVLDHYLHTAHAADHLLRQHHLVFDLPLPQPGVVVEDIADQSDALAWFAAERAVLIAATELANGSGFETHSWKLATTLGEYLGRRGHPRDLATVQTTALEAARRLEDPTGQAHAHRGLARAQAFLGLYDDAETNFQSALTMYGEVGDVIARATTRLGLAGLAERRGRYEESLDHSEHALGLFRATGDRPGQGRALNMVGWYEGHLGNHERALDFCQQALTVQRETGDRRAQADTLDSLGYAHHQLCDYRQAIERYQEALDLQREFGDHRGQADTLTHVGDSQLADDDPAAARLSWQQALAILDDLEHPGASEVRARLADLATTDRSRRTASPG
ncbi:MAG TPA: BTAD domain-containing putative transcriptional regulator [Nocardioidaceae bacterium]|nr:BTAD domain-containing putative transcriptional regulator [Nocardioidaceae bacterium]